MDDPANNTIRGLFPSLNDSEASEASDNFDAYLALIVRIYDRISADPESLADLRAAMAAHREGADEPAAILTDCEESLSI
jgi:hypothetical protein